jgi:hypothetical protein
MGKRTPLQDVESLYIGGAEPASFAGPEGQIKTMRELLGKFNDHDGAYRPGVYS